MKIWKILGEKCSTHRPSEQRLFEGNIMLLWFQTERNHSLYSEACNGYGAHFEKPVVLFFIFLSCLLYRQESVIDAEVFGARKWLTKSMNRLFWPCGTALFFP